MIIDFKGTDYEIPADIQELAERKFEGLMKHLGDAADNARAYVDLGKETGEHHQNGRIWYADVNLNADGAQYYAREMRESVEEALDAVVTELARELQSTNERNQTLARKGGAQAKELLRGEG